MKKNYVDKLKSPQWQKKRLEIMSRDKFTCKKCGDTETELHVHHLEYSNGEPWEIDNKLLITLCSDCHKTIEDTKKDNPEVPFNKIKIYKSNAWTGGSKIIYTSIPGGCGMAVYDDNNEWLCGYNITGETLRNTIAILRKAQNG